MSSTEGIEPRTSGGDSGRSSWGKHWKEDRCAGQIALLKRYSWTLGRASSDGLGFTTSRIGRSTRSMTGEFVQFELCRVWKLAPIADEGIYMGKKLFSRRSGDTLSTTFPPSWPRNMEEERDLPRTVPNESTNTQNRAVYWQRFLTYHAPLVLTSWLLSPKRWSSGEDASSAK